MPVLSIRQAKSGNIAKDDSCRVLPAVWIWQPAGSRARSLASRGGDSPSPPSEEQQRWVNKGGPKKEIPPHPVNKKKQNNMWWGAAVLCVLTRIAASFTPPAALSPMLWYPPATNPPLNRPTARVHCSTFNLDPNFTPHLQQWKLLPLASSLLPYAHRTARVFATRWGDAGGLALS